MYIEENKFENYDPDSSPYTWDNCFRKIYFEDDWEFWSAFDFDNLKKVKNRMVATNIYTFKFPIFNKWEGEILIAGDTDFNFKCGCAGGKKKYEYFYKLIESDVKIMKAQKMEYLDRLKKCNDMHYSMENFSLMLVTGGLNNKKGSFSQDRIDIFISRLDNYFKIRTEMNFKHELFANATAKNHDNDLKEKNTNKLKTILYQYFMLFSDIYDYCSKIYRISNKKFVDQLIESGEKPIITGEDVNNYMNLAITYWETKANLLSSR